MSMAIRPLLFGQDPLFKTKRVTVYANDGSPDTTSACATQLFHIGAAMNGLIWESAKNDTPDNARPSRDVAGLKLELGGYGDFFAKDVKAQTKSLGHFKQFVITGLESTWIFIRKLWWLLTKENSPGVQNVLSSLTGKSTPSAPPPASSGASG